MVDLRTTVQTENLYCSRETEQRATARAGRLLSAIIGGQIRVLSYHGRAWEPVTITRNGAGAIDGVGCREVGGSDSCVISLLGLARAVAVSNKGEV